MTSTDGVTGEAISALAESWDVSEDGLVWKFKLRDGVKWSDGADLTADDVVFTFNKIIFNAESFIFRTAQSTKRSNIWGGIKAFHYSCSQYL